MLIGILPGTPAQLARPARRGATSSGAGAAFGSHLMDAGEAAEAPCAQPACAMLGVGALPMMPETEQSDATRDRHARSHARALLTALGSLQLSILNDGGGAALETLSRLAAEASTAADPQLQAVLQAINQRVAIEVAKAEGGTSKRP